MLRRALLSSVAVLALSCAGPPDPSPFAVRVEWGLTGSSLLPSTVDTIRLVTCTVDPDTGDEACVPTNCSVAGLTGQTESETCHPAMGTEDFGDEPVLVRRGLATGTPIRFLLEARDADGGLTHTGQAGPFILGEGERRQVTVRMWTVGEGSALAGQNVGRFLHTTTWLPDGRLLVAGGFASATPGACPTDLVFPDGTQCFRAVAVAEAMAIEVASGRVEVIRSAMLEARGGHTATSLPDGRVLLVGGASEAVIAFAPIGGMDSGRYDIQILPRDAAGESTAHASYEIFDAYVGHQADDPDRDGDPARGGFIGVGGTSTPGATNQPRFLHAAAAVPSTPGRVVIAGGMGGDNTPSTYEVFDADKPGGYGFHRAGANQLGTARVAPSAVGLQGRVWIVGGTFATDNAGLADVWEAEDDANGATRPASMDSEFPSATAGTAEDHPEYSLIRPAVVAVGGGSSALVLGWYGAQCEPMMSAERFFDPATTTETCNSPMSPATRSFTVDGDTGLTAATDARPQAFAQVAVTEDFDPDREDGFRRRVVVLGGIANSTWSAQRSAEVFTGGVDSSGEASKLLGTGVALSTGRFFHTSTGVPGLGVFTVGGVEFTSRTGLRLVNSVEVFWLGQ
ncbi:MAG: hypothetical protein H6719_10860 [Sandaracinaceae bacterium]|nr:hypothetical protein [Sandaracinaceae bacterium]